MAVAEAVEANAAHFRALHDRIEGAVQVVRIEHLPVDGAEDEIDVVPGRPQCRERSVSRSAGLNPRRATSGATKPVNAVWAVVTGAVARELRRPAVQASERCGRGGKGLFLPYRIGSNTPPSRFILTSHLINLKTTCIAVRARVGGLLEPHRAPCSRSSSAVESYPTGAPAR